jgi:PAC2 family
VVLYRLVDTPDLIEPVVVAAFDGWIDAGSAATTAASALLLNETIVATFEDDRLFDYRARRPTLDIIDGRPTDLTWPAMTLRHSRLDGRDILVLTGPEPDYRWRELTEDLVALARRLGVVEWISLGAIPATVPHTRDVPILGTQSAPGLLRADVQAGPDGLLRVPAAAISVFELSVAQAGIPSLGYYAQIPHYVSGRYPTAALELLRTVSRHIGIRPREDELAEEAVQLRAQLDRAATADDTTRQYIERLESMVDESRLPSGGELISEIEQFLRERGNEGTQRG